MPYIAHNQSNVPRPYNSDDEFVSHIYEAPKRGGRMPISDVGGGIRIERQHTILQIFVQKLFKVFVQNFFALS